MAVCSEMQTQKPKIQLCGQNVELVNVKLVVHIVNHRALLILRKHTPKDRGREAVRGQNQFCIDTTHISVHP